MPFVNDSALDAYLADVAAATVLHLCSAEPATFAAVAGVSLGTVTPTFGAAGDATGGGRKRTVTFGAGNYTGTGTVSHYALVTPGSSKLHATNAFATSKAVNSGDPIQSSTFDVTVPDAVSAA